MPPGELLRIEDEEELENIPRAYRLLLVEKEKSARSTSYPTSDLEDSKVFTVRSVSVQQLRSRSPQEDDSTNIQPVAGPGRWRNSCRLRMSRHGSSPSRSGSNSRKGSDRCREPSRLRVRRETFAARSCPPVQSPFTGSSNGAGITIDVLNAEPLRAGDSWRSLSGVFLGTSAGSEPSEQRIPFGT
ncbi:hypothetical protein BDR07DRAFT_1386609, partial [Suillus spraguei]